LSFGADGGSQYGQQAIATLLVSAEKKGEYHLDDLNQASLARGNIADNSANEMESREMESREMESREMPFLGVSLSDQLPRMQPNLLKLKAIAQLHKTYILCEYPAGLWLVEQHVAHERILYEALERNWDFVEITPPRRISGLSPQQVENLGALGFEIQAFGSGVWVVRTLPKVMLEDENLVEGLNLLSQTDSLSAALATVACRCAIRNGRTLNQTRMQSLLEAWQRTQNPRTCPHGRPIYLSLDEKDLARFFRRNWMIGS
jgi:DNA mismatch repair protein MutL